MADASPISVIIPSWRRPDMLQLALDKILACDPPPAEVLVHIDADDTETAPMLERGFERRVTWFQSRTTQGPGGGRNRLIQRAKHPLIASFDDDSWPMVPDYFQRAEYFFSAHPDAAVAGGHACLRGKPDAGQEEGTKLASCFENCSCVIRRDAFMATGGFIPLQYAYGMEEADVALRLMDNGWNIYKCPDLRVFHDSELEHHASAQVNAAHITNTALLAYLRYPARCWPFGMAQVLNRVLYSLRVGRYQGILSGLAAIPFACRRLAANRRPIRLETLRRRRHLR